MTRAELEQMKQEVAREASEPEPPAAPIAPPPPPTQAAEPPPLATQTSAEMSELSEPSRKGGAPLTKEEWDEIRRERQREREQRRAEGS